MRLSAFRGAVNLLAAFNKDRAVVDDVILERVYDFIYLGSCKTSNGECKTDVERRIAQAKSKMVDLDNIWKDKDLSISLKLKIMKVLVWTTVMYGAEGWTLRQEEKKKNSGRRNVVL